MADLELDERRWLMSSEWSLFSNLAQRTLGTQKDWLLEA